MLSCCVLSLGGTGVLYSDVCKYPVILCLTELCCETTRCNGNYSDIMNAWSPSQTPCGDQTHGTDCSCFCVFAGAALTHTRIRLRPVLDCERLSSDGEGRELETASLIWTSSSFIVCHTEKGADTCRKSNTNAPPDRRLDVTSSINLAPLECWDCDQGISHLTAQAL